MRQDPQPSTSASSLTPGPVIARPLPRFQRGNEKEEATTRRWIFSEIDRERFTPAELVTRAGHPAGRSSLLSFHIFPPPSAARFFRKGARSISTRRKRITNFWTIFGRGFESRIRVEDRGKESSCAFLWRNSKLSLRFLSIFFRFPLVA